MPVGGLGLVLRGAASRGGGRVRVDREPRAPLAQGVAVGRVAVGARAGCNPEDECLAMTISFDF